MREKRDHHQGAWAFGALVAALMVAATSLAGAGEGSIRIISVEALLQQNPLRAGRRR